MMDWETEIFSPCLPISDSNWFVEENTIVANWTPQENKIFENALALYDMDMPDWWQRVADLIPGKTVWDVMKQYKELEDDVSNIEAGLVPIPSYSNSTITMDWGNDVYGFDEFKNSYCPRRKRSSAVARTSEHERKKGVPWTEEEHQLFLMGLDKYGKGDWRNISRSFVITRTSTQVASHAQKYFLRQLSGRKEKRRDSIHDITTVNLNDNQTLSQEEKKLSSPDKSTVRSHQHLQWNHPNNGRDISFNATHPNMFLDGSYGIDSYGFKPFMVSENLVFQTQSAEYYPGCDRDFLGNSQ